MLDAIVACFESDPLKILYLFGGGGGLWFWLEKWRERILQQSVRRPTGREAGKKREGWSARISGRLPFGQSRAGHRVPRASERPPGRRSLVKGLVDECVDWRLSREIVGHEVKTARQMGWSTVENGELLALTAEAFDVFVTVDRNPSFQQNIPAFAIAVIVLRAKAIACLTCSRSSPSCLRPSRLPRRARSRTWGLTARSGNEHLT